MEQRVKATSSHVKVTRLVLGRPRSSSLHSLIFRTTCLFGIQEVEIHKKGNDGFEGFLRKAGRLAHTRRKRETSRYVCRLIQAMDSLPQEKPCSPARTFPRSSVPSDSLVHRSERVRRSLALTCELSGRRSRTLERRVEHHFCARPLRHTPLARVQVLVWRRAW